MSVPELNRSRLSWWLVGIALGVALAYVVYSFIGTFVFGVFLYYSTRPIYRRLKKRVRPPSLAAAVALFVLALPVLLLVAYTGAIALSELTRLTNQGVFDLSQYPITQAQLTRLTDVERLLTVDPETITLAQVRGVFSSIGSASNVVGFVGIGLVHLFAMIAVAFYLLRDGKWFPIWLRKQVGDDHGVMEAFLAGVDNDFTHIFFGNILNAVLTGTIGVVAYVLLNTSSPPGGGVPAPELIGLLAGVASLVPVVGMKLVYVPVAAYIGATAYLSDPTTLWFTAVFVAVSFVVVDTIPDLVLRPYVSGRNLHVGAVMIAYTLGPLLFGWYGIFLGPILLVLVVNFARHVLPVLIKKKPLTPYAVDPAVIHPDEPVSHTIHDRAVATDGAIEEREPDDGPHEGAEGPREEIESSGFTFGSRIVDDDDASAE